MKEIENKLDTLIASVQSLHEKLDSLTVSKSITLSTDRSLVASPSNKGLTLAELARRAELENGQQRVAAIVGYFEKLQDKKEILIADIQQGWKDGKFSGAYAAIYLHRALKEGLVRQQAKGAYDLTQTGEDFFAKLFEVKTK